MKQERLHGAPPAVCVDTMQRRLSLIFFCVPIIVICGCSSVVDSSSTNSAFYNSEALSQPAEYGFYDSKGSRFATVTLILPSPIMSEQFDGKWCGKLAQSYVRPQTHYLLASDKLHTSGLHRLTCQRDPKQSSVAIVELNPDQPDDYIVLSMPLWGESVTGQWVYATDSGIVDSGIFTGPIHK